MIGDRIRRHARTTSGCRTLALLCLLASGPVSTPAQVSDSARIRALLHADRWSEALAEARRVHAVRPDDAEVTTVLAESLFRGGSFEECGRLLAPLADLEEPPARALTILARLHAAEGRRDAADGFLDRAVEIAPHDRDVLYWAGDLAGDRARAIELLGRYLAAADGDDPDRVEAARGALAFMRQLGERRVWVARASPVRVELPLTRLWDAAGRTEGYVVEARLGSGAKPVRLLLDTGSHGLFLVERMARKRGFLPLADATLFGGGGEGRQSTRRGVIPEFELGGLGFTDALATTTRQEFDPTGRFHGLLGIAIFGGYRVTLDLAGKRLLLEQSTGSMTGAPYWWVAGQMLTRAAAGPAQGLFVLDSGATHTVVADNLLELASRDSEGPPVSVRAFGGNLTGARLLRGVSVDFLGLRSSGEVLAYDLGVPSRLGGVEVSGLLGLDLLGQQRIVIDTTTQRIAVNP